MNKSKLIIISCILIAAGALFYDQVLAIFAGMSALEAMKFIAQFVLHVTVTTIAAYVVVTFPELIKPWMKMKKRTSRLERRPMPNTPSHAKQSMPRWWNTNQLVQAWVMRQMASGSRINGQSTPYRGVEEQPIHLDF